MKIFLHLKSEMRYMLYMCGLAVQEIFSLGALEWDDALQPEETYEENIINSIVTREKCANYS